MDNYLITVKYEDIFRPCIYNSFVCLAGQFINEYSEDFPFNYKVPDSVISRMGGQDEALQQCLLIMIGPLMGLDDPMWVCHEELKVILEFQAKLSDKVSKATYKSYDFVADHYLNGKVTEGQVILKQTGLTFMQGKTSAELKEKFIIDWKDIEPYGMALFQKEEIAWKPSYTTEKPKSDSCLKVIKNSPDAKGENDFFCIKFSKSDVDREIHVEPSQAAFMAIMYADKLNMKLQSIAVPASLKKMSENPSELDIDAKELLAIKSEIRIQYLKERHQMINNYKMGQITKQELEEALENKKGQIINSVCANFQVCIKAVQYCIDNKTLPLSGFREKYAMDLQNPFHRTMPKENIKISLPVAGGLGEQVVKAAANVMGINNFFAEKTKNNGDNGLTRANIVKAFNTIKNIRVAYHQYMSTDEMNGACNNKAPTQVSLRRKLSFLNYGSDVDIFFSYLSYIRDFETVKK